MRLVADTNTVVSALIWGGVPGRLVDAARVRRVQLVTSVPLLVELQGVLERAKFDKPLLRRGVRAGALLEGYAALVEVVVPARQSPVVLRDPDDDVVLATAVAGQVDLIVSGDARLLDIKRHRGIDIVDARTALRRSGIE